ncbi:hypothetical protein [Methanosarcina sp.]
MKRNSCCCTCSATPRNSSISCDPEAKIGIKRTADSRDAIQEAKLRGL